MFQNYFTGSLAICVIVLLYLKCTLCVCNAAWFSVSERQIRLS